MAQLVAEVGNLNSLINGIEKEMLKLKKRRDHTPRACTGEIARAGEADAHVRRYEVAVEERNYTGIQLIDRNDELCILYEKSNMQQTVLKKGELAIREREEEVRMCDLQVAELLLSRRLVLGLRGAQAVLTRGRWPSCAATSR